MFDLANTQVLHIEPTTVCQAACPQCDRENSLLYTDSKHRSELSLAQVQSIISQEVASRLDKVFMCGVFGDPAAGKETMQILQWFRSVNPTVTLGINSNGGLKNTIWWQQLGELFNQPYDYVVFSIDGLEDTNHLYRKNVNWQKLLKNVDAFIQTGASAHWDMLVFEHNKHQVESAQQFAKQLGFNWFRCKVSSRFYDKPVEGLHPPAGATPPKVENPARIDCHALNEKSMYISASGELLPCCWIGSRIFNRDIVLDQALQTDKFAGVCASWDTDNPLPICKKACGVDNDNQIVFEQQFVKQIQLK